MQKTLDFSSQKVVIHKDIEMITKGVFLLQCTIKFQISMYQEWFYNFEIGCN